MIKICKHCKKEFEAERDRREYCSLKCSAQNSTKIAGKASHKIPKTNENNPNWKDGISKDKYHYKKIQKERYPEKAKAREDVQKALKSGKLIKPNICRICGEYFEDKGNIHGHHEDYNQSLKVVWCCRKCHRELDRVK